VSGNAAPVGERVRAAEVIAALSLATDLATAGPMALVLQSLSESKRAALVRPPGEALAPFRTAAGYEVPGLAIAAVATG
jgi:hypothetical protein